MLTDTQRELAEEHLGLAYYCAHRMWLIPIELEERIGLASLGLVKAAEAWDPEEGTSFATFAARVMRNEMWMELRKMKKYFGTVSLNAPISNDNYRGVLENLVPDKKNCFEESETVLDVTVTFDRLEKQLRGAKKQVFLELLKHPGETQEFYAARAGVSQSLVSRYIRDIQNAVKEDAVLDRGPS